LACLTAVACDLGTDNGKQPSSIIVSPVALDLDAIGAEDTLTADVRDGDGRTLVGAAVSWSSADADVVTVSTTGVATAVANGVTTITATSGAATKRISVTVQQRGTDLARESGNGQTGSAGASLAQSLGTRVFDRLGNPAIGVIVSFSVADGGGSIIPALDTTGVDGRAQSAWTLGTEAGVTQRARAFVTFRAEAAVEFTATAVAGPPTTGALLSGDGQSGPKLTTLLAPVVARVTDSFGNPVPGVTASFATPGGGSFQPTSVITDSLGRATSSWTLGDAIGDQGGTVVLGPLPAIPFDAVATEVPDAVQVMGGDGQSGAVGEALAVAPSVRVLDVDGDPVASLDVRFSAPGGSVRAAGGAPGATVIVRTDASGVAALGAWILGTTPGTYELEVIVPGLPDTTLGATALTGPPTLVTRVSGDGQRGGAGAPLPAPLVARVSDAYGNPVSGVNVTFTAGAQSGSVAPTADVTDGLGEASTVWTIGSAGGAQFVTAAISGASVVFSGGVTGLSGLDIEIQYLQQPTTAQEAAFEAATNRWASVIPGRLQPQAVNIPANGCGAGSPAINRTVNDLVVLVRILPIDQAFGTLAHAGPCVARPGGGLPVVSQLTIDQADVARLEAQGTLEELVLHELAHALGFGTQWALRGLLVNPSLPNARGTDTHFRGARAIAAFDAIGGATYTGGLKVPVENREGGAGTRDSHWRLSVLENELMTGFLSGGVSPLSRLTVASLADLGYEVDESGSDPFTIGPFPSPPRVGAPFEPIPIGEDAIPGPIYEVGPDGRIRRVLVPRR